MNTINTHELKAKWAPLLESAEAPEFKDDHRKSVTAVLLENTERALTEERGQQQYLNEAAPTNATGAGVQNWDPILISLVRRSMPNLIAYDIAGVQPMTGPTGLIFAMKSTYASGANNGNEALFGEADSSFSANNAGEDLTNGDTSFGGNSSSLDPTFTDAATDDGTLDDDPVTGFGTGEGIPTANAETLGSGVALEGHYAEMGFSIDKSTVTAKSRALKAEYSMELAQDLKAVHGLDAETELANILSTEIMAEINREVIRTINVKATLGATGVTEATGTGAGVKGRFNMDVDADGRWFVEKIKGLVYQIQKEAAAIAVATRRGAGNFCIVSPNVAAGFSAAGMLDYNANFNGTSINSDVNLNTFAGMLGKLKVYIDPYATAPDYVNVGYKGSNAYDAGLFYCPYVPLTMVRAVGENTFQPKIGFKTRYGMVANPYVATDGTTGANRSNPYYRIFGVVNL